MSQKVQKHIGVSVCIAINCVFEKHHLDIKCQNLVILIS
jgi:hypothetical protein